MDWTLIVYYFIALALVVIGGGLCSIQMKTVTATVTSISPFCSPITKNNFCRISVKYTVDGKEYSDSLRPASKRYGGQVNDPIKVKYLSNNPSNVSSTNPYLISGIVLIIVGILMLVLPHTYKYIF
jgi:hypothetical protein